MGCTACSRQILQTFLNDFAGLTIQSQPLSGANRRILRQGARRAISTSTQLRHQPSSRRLDSSLAVGESFGPDDSFIPFEPASGQAPARNVMNGTYLHAPAVPADARDAGLTSAPLYSSHTSTARFEPEIEFEGDLKGLNATDLRRQGLVESSPPKSEISSTQRKSSQPAVRKYGARANTPSSRVTAASVKPRHATSRHTLRALAHAQRTSRNPPDAVRALTADAEVPSVDTNPAAKRPQRPAVQDWSSVAERAGRRHNTEPPPFERAEPWQSYKDALKAKFGDDKWQPRKKLSPDAVEGIRALHAQYPHQFTTPVLADQFKVSPEAIRRILKSKWRPNSDEEEDRRRRWDKRGEKIWAELVDKGLHPPKKWRQMGIGGGPRYRGQDRSLEKASQDGTPVAKAKDSGGKGADGSAWLRSFAERVS